MIGIRLKGGLGNQMFQYAFARQLALKLNTDLKLDLTVLLDRSKKGIVPRGFDMDIFDLPYDFLLSPSIIRFFQPLKSARMTGYLRRKARSNLSHIKEQYFHFDPKLIGNPQDHTLYEGWFQSYKYFEDIQDQIRMDFQFKDDVLEASKELDANIRSKQSICLNVRRTDFLQVDTLNTTNLDYFLRAAKLMMNQVANPHFFIFSDDIEWCRENIELDAPTVIVNHSHKGHKFGNYLQLMSHCNHFIIPNSSFAYWAAWLSENPHKQVIAPKDWFTDPDINTSDVTPPSWVRM